MNWDNVELIRNAQASAKSRLEATALATQEEIQKVVNSEAAKNITMPRLTEIEQMIFKMRSELIDYIVAHGLVDGLIWDGVLQPIQNGKIVITKEMIEILTEHLGYFTEADVQAFLETYLPENNYVSDASYVHTDNNFTTPEKQKLAGIEAGAEVNKIIDLVFNGVSVLDDGTRVATINITPEDIKRWYEENPDTNAFTDAQKTKLAGISDGAEVNRVDDVLVDGRSVLADDKKAKITPEDIKKAYEKNPDTNAYTDAEKADLAALKAWKPQAAEDIANNTAEIAEAKQSISELGGELNTVEGRVTTLEANTTQLRTDVDEIGTRVTKTETDVAKLSKRVTKNETDIVNAQGTANTALTAVNDLTKTVNDQDRSIDELNRIVNNHDVGIDDLKAKKIPYYGARQTVDLNGQSLNNVGILNIGTITRKGFYINSEYIENGEKRLMFKGYDSSYPENRIVSNKMIHLTDRASNPTDKHDITTKEYVDKAIASAGGGPSIVDNPSEADFVVVNISNTASNLSFRYVTTSATWGTSTDSFISQLKGKFLMQKSFAGSTIFTCPLAIDGNCMYNTLVYNPTSEKLFVIPVGVTSVNEEVHIVKPALIDIQATFTKTLYKVF